MKIGLIGAGRFAFRRLLPHLVDHPYLKLEIIHNRSLEKAKSLAKTFQVQQATNLEREVLEHPALNGIIICSPNYLHQNLTLRALERGLAVWVEKPLTLTSQEAQDIMDLYPSARLMVGQCYRFKSALQMAKQKVDEKLIGDLKSIDLKMHMKIPQIGWRATKRYGGGVLLELGIHLVDTLHFLSNQKVDDIYALGNFIEDDEGTPIIWELKVLGKTQKYLPFTLSISFNAPYSTGFQLIGTKGELYGEFIFRGEDDEKEKLLFRDLNDETHLIDVIPQNVFKQEIEHFYEVLNGHSTSLNLLQGIENMKVLDAIDQSLRQESAIKLEKSLRANSF